MVTTTGRAAARPSARTASWSFKVAAPPGQRLPEAGFRAGYRAAAGVPLDGRTGGRSADIAPDNRSWTPGTDRKVAAR